MAPSCAASTPRGHGVARPRAGGEVGGLSPTAASTAAGGSSWASGRSAPAASTARSPYDEVVGTQEAAARWRRGRPLGTGSFGVVYKGFDPTSLRLLAVREVPLDTLGAAHRQRLELELGIFQTLRHPNIVSHLGHERAGGHLCILLEYVPGGSMSSFLREFGALDGEALKRASRGTLEGLHYLHTRSPPVVHGDVKGANILVDTSLSVKLGDFGCSRWDTDNAPFATLGSLPWMAPEVIAGKGRRGRGADVWSFGCAVAEMATAERPWGDAAYGDLAAAVRRLAAAAAAPPVPGRAPDACRALVAACTRRERAERPEAGLLLRHEFVALP